MIEYALIASTDEWEEDPGCTEDHEHSWCEQPSYALSVTPVSLHRERRTFRMGYELVHDREYSEALYGVADVAVGDTAFLLLIEYIDGGTFGYSGYWCCAGVFSTAEEAEAARKRAEGENDTARMYRPWDGYFASLRSAEVHPMTVLS